MKKVYYYVTKGKSFISKSIELWTRSYCSHAGFIDDTKLNDVTLQNLKTTKDCLIEAWVKPKEHFWQMRVIRSSLSYHSPGTHFEVFELKVNTREYHKIHEFQNICVFLEVPYDWKAIVGFVLRFKMRNNGKLFCSEKECMSLKYAGILPNDFPCWRVHPSDFKYLLKSLGAKKVLEFTT